MQGFHVYPNLFQFEHQFISHLSMFYLRSLSLEGLQHLLRGCVSTKFRKEWSMKLWDSNVLVHTLNWDIHCTVWYQLQTWSLPSYLLVSLGFVFVFEFSLVLVVAFVLVFVFAVFWIFVFAFFLIVFVWSDHLINCRRTDGTVIGCSVAAVAWRRRRIFRICNLLCLYLPIFLCICNYICNIQHLSVFTLMALEFVIKRQININVPEILCKRVRGLRHKCTLLNWVAIIH